MMHSAFVWLLLTASCLLTPSTCGLLACLRACVQLRACVLVRQQMATV
jgi:hypothetical protein